MNLRYMMVDNGRVLATRNRGKIVADHLGELANHVAERDRVLIDFEGVEVVTPNFAQEVLRELGLLFGDRPTLINMNEEVTSTIDFVRESTYAYDAPPSRTKTCGVHSCKNFGQHPWFGIRLHNLFRHYGK